MPALFAFLHHLADLALVARGYGYVR